MCIPKAPKSKPVQYQPPPAMVPTGNAELESERMRELKRIRRRAAASTNVQTSPQALFKPVNTTAGGNTPLGN